MEAARMFDDSWWVTVIFVFLFLLLVFLIVKWYSQRRERGPKEADKAKSLFFRSFANITSEFRNPLALTIEALEQIRSDYQGKESEKKINLALRHSQRLLDVINQWLDLAKLESGEIKLQTSRQNMIPLLNGLVSSFEPVAVKHQLDLRFHAQEENIVLFYDPGKMQRVICNLMLHALETTPAGGKITVSAATQDDCLEIAIRRTGMADANGSITGDQEHKDFSIGFALVRELIFLHHGDFNFKNSPGRGTEYIIRLPLGKAHLTAGDIFADAAPGAADLQKSACDIPDYYKGDAEVGEDVSDIDQEAGQGEKQVILVVEDSPPFRYLIRSTLNPFYTVMEASNGREGIEKARDIIPDLIVSDIIMPEKDGYQLCHVLKTDIRTSHIPIIMLTVKTSEESIVKGLKTGADDYITKPFHTSILLARIRNLIDLRRQFQQRIQRDMKLQPTEISMSRIDQGFMKELQEAIETHISDPEFNVDQLAGKLYLSHSTLYRKVNALTGESPKYFIQSYRLKRAAQLLRDHFGNVTDVAYEVGFSSSAYFTKCFREKFQQLPSDFMGSHG
jgi:DNA-binding response OmpR family regulator